LDGHAAAAAAAEREEKLITACDSIILGRVNLKRNFSSDRAAAAAKADGDESLLLIMD
jgi:hypothetical protein